MNFNLLYRFRIYDIDTQFQSSKEEVLCTLYNPHCMLKVFMILLIFLFKFQMLKLDEQQFLGEATCTLSEVITKSNRTVALELTRKEGTQPQNHGKLIVHAEESLASKTTTEIVFRCLNLESMDHFSKSVSYCVTPFLP